MSVVRPLIVGLLALGLALVASFAAARDATASPAPGLIEVGPGIYISAASDLPPIETMAASDAASNREESRAVVPFADPAGAPQPFVVGGKKTSIRRWPWQVSLQYPSTAPEDPRNAHVCGGSLVSPSIVVTAAHCVNFGSTIFRPPEEFQVISGRTKLRSDQGQVHDVADYYYFADEQGQPLWDRTTITWDVVFLELATDSDQRTIKIAGPGEELVWTPGTWAFGTGWGVTRETEDEDEVVPPSNALRLARVRMISDSSCDDVYGSVFVPSLMVCAGERAGGVDVCSGDSGGPLVVRVQGGWRLVGNTSFADGCGLPHIPGVYGRLATDPIRGALANGIRIVAGAEVLGSDAAPSNGFNVRQVGKNQRRGTARVVALVPSRGMVEIAASRRIRGVVKHPREAGRVALAVRPRGMAMRRLDRFGRLTISVKLRFRPFNGEPSVRLLRVGLVKAGG